MGPMIVEFGLGTSLRRGDYTQAAERAVRAALWRNSINLAEYMGVAKEDMTIEVRIGCAQPEAVDVGVLAGVLKVNVFCRKTNTCQNLKGGGG